MSENGRSGREPVIVSAARTPIGRLGGSLAGATAPQLGAAAVRAAVERAGIPPEAVDEVIMGQVIQAGAGQAPARQAALRGGLPDTVGAVTVNKVCGSGLKAVMLASSCILAGEGDLYVAGGMESMSSAPYLLPDARRGARFGHVQALDSIVRDGLWCSFTEAIMGDAAEFIADQYEITRQEMDVFALESHQKAIAAIDSGRFKREIVPVEVREGKTTKLVDTDEGPRRDTSLEALGRLRPAFRDEGGRVTAGNAPGLNDGAAALVVMAREQAERLGVRPIARIVGYTHAAVEPRWLFIGPARAVPRLLERIGWRLEDADLIEINEAFASQVLADGKDLIAKGHAWDWAKVNVHGGAVALGHPIGASGARVLVTLIHALQDRGGRRGLATLCLGGGEAVALAVELE
jgi:acetyl-CoA C-acetyltransferase